MILGPLGRELEIAEAATVLPPDALPTREDLPAGTVLRCTVLIPAHNEEAVLGLTLESLAQQSRRPTAWSSLPTTVATPRWRLLRAHGVEVVETAGNTEKKAGALNQQLARLLPHAAHRDVLMVMDADSTLSPNFLEVALGLLEDDPDLVAVGGLFYGEDGGRLVGQFQRNEYTRYQRLVARQLGRVFVLTGTASLIRAYALRAVAEARGPLLPGPAGSGLRHARADRGQRAHPGVEDLGSADDIAPSSVA